MAWCHFAPWRSSTLRIGKRPLAEPCSPAVAAASPTSSFNEGPRNWQSLWTWQIPRARLTLGATHRGGAERHECRNRRAGERPGAAPQGQHTAAGPNPQVGGDTQRGGTQTRFARCEVRGAATGARGRGKLVSSSKLTGQEIAMDRRDAKGRADHRAAFPPRRPNMEWQKTLPWSEAKTLLLTQTADGPDDGFSLPVCPTRARKLEQTYCSRELGAKEARRRLEEAGEFICENRAAPVVRAPREGYAAISGEQQILRSRRPSLRRRGPDGTRPGPYQKGERLVE